MKYHQLFFDLLARQYEAARMDEMKTALMIQVIDAAELPDRKSAPFKALYALGGGALGLVPSCGYVLASIIYRRLTAD